MITTLNLNLERKAKIWLGELPNIVYSPIDILEQRLNTKSADCLEIKKAAIEMMIPASGRILYGLLGVEFIPSQSQYLTIKIAIAQDQESEISDTLISNLDIVRAGLPLQYANSIFEGVINSSSYLTAGILLFNCGAHGEIGSSPRMFRQLASTIIKLIATQNDSELSLSQLIAY